MLKICAERCSSGEDVAKRGEIVLVDDRMFGDSENDRRNETSCCTAVRLNELEGGLEIEFRENTHCSTVVEDEVKGDLQSEDVV